LRLQRDREAAEVARVQLVNKVIPWLYAAGFILFLALVILAGAVVYRRLNPKVITPYPVITGGPARILSQAPNFPLVITDGISGILHIPNLVRGTAEADPALAIPAQATYNLADHGPFDLGHYLIAGETRSGKGTLGRYILANLRQDVYIAAVDPHYAAGNWGNVHKVIGAGRDFNQGRGLF
jgi:hypothetical protein